MSDQFGNGDPIRAAVARKIARRIDGGDPIEDMTVLEVAESALSFEDKLTAKLAQLNVKWQELQDEMFAKQISDTSDRWASAQRIYEIQVRAIENRLVATARMGTKP